MTGTETEVKEVDTEDNLSGTSAHLKQKKLVFFCVFTSSIFYFQLSTYSSLCRRIYNDPLYSKHAVNYELEKLKSAKNKIHKADTQLGVSIGAEWETAKNVDTD